MIRDPSDGSVRVPIKPDLTDTGLPKPETESERETRRLERDREWLKNWRARNSG